MPEKEHVRPIPLTIAIGYLITCIHVTKEVKYLHNKDYKTLKKEIEENTETGKIFRFMDWRN